MERKLIVNYDPSIFWALIDTGFAGKLEPFLAEAEPIVSDANYEINYINNIVCRHPGDSLMIAHATRHIRANPTADQALCEYELESIVHSLR